MVTSIYLDALSSGMRARLDPAYRFTKQHKPAGLSSSSHGGPDLSGYRSSSPSATTRKPLGHLKARIAAF